METANAVQTVQHSTPRTEVREQSPGVRPAAAREFRPTRPLSWPERESSAPEARVFDMLAKGLSEGPYHDFDRVIPTGED
jgi:hypothetical protein